MHSIRLRGPWQFEVVGGLPNASPGEVALPRAGQVEVPGDWGSVLGTEFRGRVRYRRRFGRPSGTWSRLWLVFERIEGTAAILLGDQPLATIRSEDCPVRLDVTNFLAPRNELKVDILQRDDAPRPGGIVGEVRLEILE